LLNSRKCLQMVLLLLSLVLLIAACSKSADSGNAVAGPAENGTAGNGNAGTSGEDMLMFSYTLPTQYANWLRDKLWLPVVEERTNTKVEILDGGDGDQYYSNMDLRIGSGDFPDTGIVRLAQAEVYGAQGAFVDLKPIIEEHAPNIKRFMEEHPDYASLITSANGAIYGIMAEYPIIAEVIMYREDMFEKAGITKLPETIEELTDAFHKLKAHYKDDPDFYPFSGRENFIKFTELFLAGDGIEDGRVYGIYENGRGYDLYSPGFRRLIEWYAELYKEGLIDPEWVAGAATEESWQTKMLNGKGAVSYDYYTRPTWFMDNGGPDIDPDYRMNAMPYLKDINGNPSKPSAYFPRWREDRVMVINRDAADKAPGIVKFIDYLFSEEGQELVSWGIQGVTYEVVDGEKRYLLDFAEETYKPIGTPRWDFVNDQLHFPKPVDHDAFYQWNSDLVKSYASKFFANDAIRTYPVLKYTMEQIQVRANLVAKVKPQVTSNLVAFITGKRPMSEWDAFLAEMEKEGYKEIVAIDQAAYDAMQ